jgi:predicted dinucleotide-binding enzyme
MLVNKAQCAGRCHIAGRLFAKAGHEVLFSFSRDPQALAQLAAKVGPNAKHLPPGPLRLNQHCYTGERTAGPVMKAARSERRRTACVSG